MNLSGDEKYISTIVDISEYNPEDDKETEEEGIVISKRSVEGYIFDAETGDYVSKDEIIGKNYQLIYDLIYRIQGGYEYADLLDESIQRPSDIPANNTIGKEFYESGSAWIRHRFVSENGSCRRIRTGDILSSYVFV